MLTKEHIEESLKEIIYPGVGKDIITLGIIKSIDISGDSVSVELDLRSADSKLVNGIENAVKEIQEEVGDNKIICGLSGGVDSSVAALLVHKAVGDNLTCVFVDHGLLRKGEAEQVEETFRKHFKINLVSVNAEERFLSKQHQQSCP